MLLKNCILLLSCSVMYTNANIINDIVIDYFTHKKVSNVIGISCNDADENMLLLKKFNSKNILANFYKLNDRLKIDFVGKTNYRKLGIFLDLRCYKSKLVTSIFLEATENKMFNDLHKWLIIGPNLNDTLTLVNDRLFGFSTDFVIAVRNNTYSYCLYDIYNLSKERSSMLNISLLGIWNYKNNGLNITLKQEPFERRKNFHRIVLRAAFWKSAYRPDGMSLKEHFEDFAHATRDGQAKFAYQILCHLADLYNFILMPLETPKWEPGDPVGPITRALINNTAELTGSPLVMNVRRSYLMKYTFQVWPFRTCFIFRNPQPSSFKIREILKPFTNEVWYTTCTMLLVIMIIFTVTLQYEGINTELGQFSNSFILTISTMCMQGTNLNFESVSTRMVFFFAMVFNVLMYNYYSASVVSARLGEQVFKINDSLSEFGKLRLKMSSEWMAYLDFFLKYPDWETRTFYQNYWLKLSEKDRYMLPEIGMELVKRGGFAYHTHPNIGYPFIEKYYDNRDICELMEVHVARPIFTTMGVQLNSTITEMTRIGLTKISEVGLRSRQVLKFQYRKPICRQDILTTSSIKMNEFVSHLIVLSIGIVVGVTICIIEIIIALKVLFDKSNE